MSYDVAYHGWGSILAVRTGPASLGAEAMLRLRGRGYRHVDGCVLDRARRTVPTPTEAAFFALAGMPLLEPAARTHWPRYVSPAPPPRP